MILGHRTDTKQWQVVRETADLGVRDINPEGVWDRLIVIQHAPDGTPSRVTEWKAKTVKSWERQP